MAHTINDLAGEEQLLLGQNINIIAIPQRLLFPKQELSTIESGTFGILSVDVETVKSGEIPECFNIGWGAAERFYNIVIKGKLPRLVADARYNITATLVSHPQYGLSYQIVEISREDEIKTVDEEKEFIYYVFGDTLAKLFYAVFDDPFKLFIGNSDNAIDNLIRIQGIGKKRAIKLVEKFRKNAPNFKAIVYLQGKYGLTPTAVSSLIQEYKSIDTVIEKIEENPYILSEVDGWGFARCDKVALAKGISPESEFRIKAYIKYYLSEQAEINGHSWLYLQDLYVAIKNFVPAANKNKIIDCLQNATGRNCTKEIPWLYYDETNKRIGLKKYRIIEEKICHELFRLLRYNNQKYNNPDLIDCVISKCEEENGWKYTEEQKNAIYGCIKNNVNIITGFSGSGKTSVMKPMVQYFLLNNLEIAQTALSGRAASNLSEITNIEGQTIHRLLGYKPEVGFTKNKTSPLRYDVIIIDEVSMNDNNLFLSLLEACKDGCKIIMLGDLNQIEPLGWGNVFKDCLETNVVPCYRFTKIQRQAQKSAIITNSIKIANGEQIIGNQPINEVRGELKDLKVVTYTDISESKSRFLKEYTELIQKGVHPNDIVGIVPMKTRGDLSCLVLNNEIQKIVNNDEELPSVRISLKEGSYVLRLGDKVINKKNHYDTVSYAKFLEGETEDVEPIYNGNIGVITRIEKEFIVIDFKQQKEVVVTRNYWNDIMLGYVCSGHSFQGSQAPYIIVGVDMSSYMLLSKEWLYTSETRPRKYCVLVGQISAIKRAINTSKIAKKQTWLKELLREENKSG